MLAVRFAVVATLVILPGCKGDRAKCEQAVRNYSQLTYWQRVNGEIAALPEAQRDGVRKKRLSEFTNELETRLDAVVDQCVSANNEEQVDCMIAAKTADEVGKCADPAGSD